MVIMFRILYLYILCVYSQTGAAVESAYETKLNASSLNVTELFLYQLCYDATWTLAKALNNTVTGTTSF